MVDWISKILKNTNLQKDKIRAGVSIQAISYIFHLIRRLKVITIPNRKQSPLMKRKTNSRNLVFRKTKSYKKKMQKRNKHNLSKVQGKILSLNCQTTVSNVSELPKKSGLKIHQFLQNLGSKICNILHKIQQSLSRTKKTSEFPTW